MGISEKKPKKNTLEWAISCLIKRALQISGRRFGILTFSIVINESGYHFVKPDFKAFEGEGGEGENNT